jgi:hypothetical protein
MTESKKLRIFLSYGHDKYVFLINKVKERLEKEGFKTWMDKDNLSVTGNFDIGIEQGIESSDWIVAFMTQHAYRRPDGVCLDEISYARLIKKPVIPIMVQEVKPPLLISRIQWLDLQDLFDHTNNCINEGKFEGKFQQLLAVIKGEIDLYNEGLHCDVKNLLYPFNNDSIMAKNLQDFVGCEWIIQRFDDWISNNAKSRVFWIIGNAGSGKTCVASYLAHQHNNVLGVHFCNYYSKKSGDLKLVFKSLSYYMATQIPQYMEFISTRVDLSRTSQLLAIEIFEILFVEPLKEVKSDKKCFFVLDAIDEIEKSQVNELLRIFNNYSDKLPDWFGIVITSRPELNILSRIGSFEPFFLKMDDDLNHEADLRHYIFQRLKLAGKSFSNAEIERLIEKSEGSFIYLKNMMNNIISLNMYSIDNMIIPNGISGIYCEYFDRCVQDVDYYKKNIRHVLEVICCGYDSFDVSNLAAIVKFDEYEINDIINSFGSLIIEDHGKYYFVHKSIKDWLLDRNCSGQYYINYNSGHRKIIDWIKRNSKEFFKNSYLKEFALIHLFENKEYEEVLNLLQQYNNIIMKLFLDTIMFFVDKNNLETIYDYFSYQENLGSQVFLYKTIKMLIEYDKIEIAEYLLISQDIKTKKKLNLYSKLILERKRGKTNQVIKIGKKAVKLLEKENCIGDVYHLLAEGYRESGLHQEALVYYSKVKDSTDRNDLIYFENHCALIDLQYVYGNCPIAFQMLEELNKYNINPISYDRFKICRLYGNLYESLSEIANAKNYFNESLTIALKIKRPYSIVEAYNSMAGVVGYDKSMEYITQGRKIANEIGAKLEMGKSYYIIAEKEIEQKIYSKAVYSGMKSLEILELVGYGSGCARANYLIGLAFYHKKEYEKAISFFKNSYYYYDRENIYPHLRVNNIYYYFQALKKLVDKRYRTLNLSVPNIEYYPKLEMKIREIKETING